jgi:hypothetical protein
MEITSDSERIRRQAALLNDCHQRILDLQAQKNAKEDTIARLREAGRELLRILDNGDNLQNADVAKFRNALENAV